jgi:formamidopyrimidine-DNA glycosylase
MPELPEVETAARQLRDWVQGRRLLAAHAEATRVTRGQDREGLSRVVGHRLLSIERLGKWMLLSFDRGAGLLSHLGMTGKWLRRGRHDAAPSHVRATLEFEGGVFADYRDPRLFGRLLAGPTEALRKLPTLAALGPDPLGGIDVRALAAALGKTQRSIKEALMDQTTLAGLGNIQVSESLHRAGLHPERTSASLTPAEVQRLATSIGDSLRFTLEHEKGEEPIDYVEEGGANYFLVYGRAGEPCKSCQTPLERIVQGGRSTFFCPRCQPLKGASAQRASAGVRAATRPPPAANPRSARPPAKAARLAKKVWTPKVGTQKVWTQKVGTQKVGTQTSPPARPSPSAKQAGPRPAKKSPAAKPAQSANVRRAARSPQAVEPSPRPSPAQGARKPRAKGRAGKRG